MESLINLDRIREIREIIGQNDAFSMDTLFGEFCKSARTTLGKLKETESDGNPQNFRALVHSLKGASLNVGAARLAEHCLMTEKQSDSLNPDSRRNLIAEMEKIFLDTEQAYKNV